MAVPFGAAVTKTNGSEDCTGAGARLPHPTSKILARSITKKSLLIDQGYCDTGVLEAVCVGTAVGKSGMLVTPGTGVRVGTLGTQSN